MKGMLTIDNFYTIRNYKSTLFFEHNGKWVQQLLEYSHSPQRAIVTATHGSIGVRFLFFSIWTVITCLLSWSSQLQAQQNCNLTSTSVQFTTTATPPISSNIAQAIFENKVRSTITNTISAGCQAQVFVFGRIERIAPSTFSIILNPNGPIPPRITINSNIPVQLDASLQRSAFGNFNPGNLEGIGINLASITDAAGTLQLPSGTYRICYTARYFINGVPGNLASDSTKGCSNQFTILPCAPNANSVQVTTNVGPFTNPVISQAVASGLVNTQLQFNNPAGCNTTVKVFGSIKRLSPAPFTITLNSTFRPTASIALNAGVPVRLNPAQIAGAFGNFNPANLAANGIDLATITDDRGNLRLPDGTYQFCLSTRYFTNNNLGGNASDPQLGCGSFTLCNNAQTAPLVSQPVNNLNINSPIPIVRPAPSIAFAWTPPHSTCGIPPGGYTYDLELRELLEGQTVTDAINNPYTFRKTGLTTNIFMLENQLFPGVLQEGRRYILRVKANLANTAGNPFFTIANNGFSRVEAFQYGNSRINPAITFRPDSYFIPLRERKSNFWDDALTAFEKNQRKDTLVPIREYISLVLARRAIVYSLDAIDLLLTMNHGLIGKEEVPLSTQSVTPTFLPIAANQRTNYGRSHAAYLSPDKAETLRFIRLLDSLTIANRTQVQAVQGSLRDLLNSLLIHLNNFKTQVDGVNRLTMNLINEVMAELVREIRTNPQSLNRNQTIQREQLIFTLEELIASPDASSSLAPHISPLTNSKAASSAAEKSTHVNTRKFAFRLPYMDQLLSFDIIVWRYTKDQPPKAVYNTSDLITAYKVYYIVPGLYQSKNPKTNARSTIGPASTAQVSLPNARFKFWTENMITKKTTEPQDIEMAQVYMDSKKNWPYPKKFSIVLKVDQ